MRLLAIFSHPDDELGCVGTLKKHAERGDETMLVWTTYGELASQYVEHSDAEVRATRAEHAAFIAGQVGAAHRFFDMGDSRMTGARDEALQIARLYATFKPDAVITWGDHDGHPDHRMTAKICYDALTLARIPKILNEFSDTVYDAHRKPIRFFQYASGASQKPFVHVDISEHIDLVQELFEFYRDFYGWEFKTETFTSLRALYGRESGVAYAERFQRRASFAPAVDFLV